MRFLPSEAEMKLTYSIGLTCALIIAYLRENTDSLVVGCSTAILPAWMRTEEHGGAEKAGRRHKKYRACFSGWMEIAVIIVLEYTLEWPRFQTKAGYQRRQRGEGADCEAPVQRQKPASAGNLSGFFRLCGETWTLERSKGSS